MTAPLAYDFSRAKTDEGDWAVACEGRVYSKEPERQDRYAEELWRQRSARAEMACTAGDDGPPRRRKRSNFWRNLWRWLKSPVSGFFGD